jgi:hypothetical protein
VRPAAYGKQLLVAKFNSSLQVTAQRSDDSAHTCTACYCVSVCNKSSSGCWCAGRRSGGGDKGHHDVQDAFYGQHGGPTCE